MVIENKYYSISDIEQLFKNNNFYEIELQLIEKVKDCYNFLISKKDLPDIYGLNTGFGPMIEYKISNDDIKQLQYNLIVSHAVGMGNLLPANFSKYIIITRLFQLLKGFSAVSSNLIYRILYFLNNKIYPVVHEHGSVGASGDLIQLAEIMNALIGNGYVYYNGEILPTKKLDLPTFELGLRDGLGFINGTSAMTAIAIVNLLHAKNLIKLSINISSVLYEIFNSYDDAYSMELNNLKFHYGQQQVALRIIQNLENSTLISKRFNDNKYTPKIQEIYSLRCVPQIIGPIYDTFKSAEKVIIDEFNSISDNPIFDYQNNKILFGGNFHGDYVSFEMDKLKIAITKLSILLNRQLVLLLNNDLNKRFPPFLNYQKLGLNLALQATEFISASTTAENQTLSYPNYIHNIPSNKDNQDVVSMGTNSAIIANKVIMNTYDIISPLLLSIMYVIYNNKIFQHLTKVNQENILSYGYKNIDYNNDNALMDNLHLIKNNIIYNI